MGRGRRVAAPRAAPAQRRGRRRRRRQPARLDRARRPTSSPRIVAAAEGNPLYVEQILSMLVESKALRAATTGAGCAPTTTREIAIPPTIKALLEARLGQLARRGAHRDRAGVGDRPAVPVAGGRVDGARALQGRPSTTICRRSTRKQFVHAVPMPDDDPIYRFHHHLVRDTIYNGLLKRTRATLHVDFVRWADKINAERGRGLEFEEILGYHLEQAHRYLGELGPLDEKGARDRPRRRRGASRRPAGARSRAATCTPPRTCSAAPSRCSPRTIRSGCRCLPELGEVLLELGQFADARAARRRGAREASTASATVASRPSAELVRLLLRLHSGEPGNWGEAALAAHRRDDSGARARERARRAREGLAAGRAGPADQRAARRGGAEHRARSSSTRASPATSGWWRAARSA